MRRINNKNFGKHESPYWGRQLEKELSAVTKENFRIMIGLMLFLPGGILINYYAFNYPGLILK